MRPIEILRRLWPFVLRSTHERALRALAAQTIPAMAGAQCGVCGFRYWEYRGHIIPCPRCEAERLRAQIEAEPMPAVWRPNRRPT